MKRFINSSIYTVIAALIIVPFAVPYAYYPLSKFYSEAFSLICGLLIFVLAIWKVQKIKITPPAIACILFAGYLIIQIFVVQIRFVGNNEYTSILFFILALTSIGFASLLEDDQSQNKLINIICWSLVISATIQSLIAYLQFTGKANQLSQWILVTQDTHDGSNIFGNIGQPNQFVDFISIDVVALLYLYFIGQINLLVFLTYSIIFALAITITARRAVLTYYIVMIVFAIGAWLANFRNKNLSAYYKKAMLIVIGFSVGLVAVELIFPKLIALNSSHSSNIATGINRLAENSIGQSTYRRFYEWYKAWILFTEHPLFGIGWYQYPREGIYIMNTAKFMYIPENMKLYTHCHNSLLNIMAEAGAIGTLISVFYGIFYSIYAIFKRMKNPKALFIVLLTIPILMHSFFEYPLWYAYFIVPLVIFLSFAKASYEINNNLIIKLVSTVIFIGFMGFAYNANQVNNRLIAYTQAPTDFDDYSANVSGLTKMIDTNNIWSMSAMMVLDNYINPGSQSTNSVMLPAQQLKYIDILGNNLPYPGALFKQIVIHKIVGDNKGANYYADILAHAYPYYKEQFINQLQQGTEFADVITTLQAFHYEDKSELSKLFKKRN